MARNFEITSEMAKGFAAEMTEKREKINSKNGCAIANFIATAKGGKTTDCGDGSVIVSTNVKINYPFNVCKPNNIRKEVRYDANNTVVGGSNTILCHVADALFHLMSIIDSIKTWGFEAGFSKDYFECYPDLRPAIEKYGFEWFEEKYNEFSEYLTKLGGVAEEQVENVTPMLNDDEQGLMRQTDSNVKVIVNDLRNNGGEYKWQVNAVNRIKALNNIYDLDKAGVEVEIIVNSSEIVVKAEHDGVKYNIDTPITPKSSLSKIDNTVGHAFDALSYVLSMVVCEQEEDIDNEDIDKGIERVVDTIKDYVNNYEGLMMDYDGNSASICVGWDNFNEDDMKMLIEDGDMYKSVGYALMVDGVPIRDILVYYDGVYVSVDVKMFNRVA